MNRESLLEMERELSRRGFFGLIVKGAGIAAALDRLGPLAQAVVKTKRPNLSVALKVYSAIGNITIPVDEDPGWATFDPGISEYGLNVYVKQIFLGNNGIAFDAYTDTLNDFNEAPVVLGYEKRFLEMFPNEQTKYLTDVVTGNFENDGYQEVLTLAANASVVSAKTTFFSNYPRHLSNPNAEFQVFPPSPVKTGFDIMRLKGPVGQQEEEQLRKKYYDAEELPGVDLNNPWI